MTVVVQLTFNMRKDQPLAGLLQAVQGLGTRMVISAFEQVLDDAEQVGRELGARVHRARDRARTMHSRSYRDDDSTHAQAEPIDAVIEERKVP